MSWTTSPDRPTAVGVRGMVATSQPLAAAAGVRALEAGGNAMDAALAAAGVLAVTEPNQCGPGGDLFAIVLRDGERPVGLDASGRSPREPGDAVPELFGPRSVTVPGCPAGWTDLARRFSKLGLERALAPGVDLARRGFAMAPKNRRRVDGGLEGSGRRGGRGVPAGRSACQPCDRRHARADRRRALLPGADGTGDRRRELALAGRSAEHENRWVDPVEFASRFVLLEMPPPGQGSIAGWALESLASPAPRTRWTRWPTLMRAATRRSAARRTCVPRTVTAWRSR